MAINTSWGCGVTRPGLNLSYSNTGKVGEQRLLVHQLQLSPSCMLGVLRVAWQVRNNCITINLQLESLRQADLIPLQELLKAAKFCPRSSYSVLQIIQEAKQRVWKEEFCPMSLAPRELHTDIASTWYRKIRN